MPPDSRLDAVTGLLTESGFRAAVAGAVTECGESPDGCGVAVLSIHLDRLADPCGARGRDTVERVVQAAAERLRGCVRAQDQISHAGHGRFRVILDPVRTAELAASMASKICRVLRLPFTLGHDSVTLSASIGISMIARDGKTADALILQADDCMHRAAQTGDCYRFSEWGVGAPSSLPFELDEDPRKALNAGQFELHYQPRVSVRDGRMVTAEALTRWPHPVHGNIPPSTFIPVAESTGFIQEMGAWILDRACSQAAAWQRHGSAIQVAVNVSGRQLEHPDFPELVEQTLERTGLPAALLELEITESAFMRRPDDVTAVLARLRHLGISIALDDFGTGYSSLAYLRRFPLDTLKIDRSFIADVAQHDGSAVLLRSIVDLAHALALRVVVEGVETPEQRAVVEGQGGDEMQGFLISPAIPADKLEQRFLWKNLPDEPARA